MKVKTQLWTFGITTLLLLVLLGGISYHLTSKLLLQLDDVSTSHLPAVRAMITADMMHDGLRAVFYRSLLAAQGNDVDGLKESEQERVEMSKNFEDQMALIETLRLNPETRQAIEDAKPAMKSYLALVSELVDLTAGGQIKEVNSRMGEFNHAFKELEAKMESLGELIEKDAFSTRDDGKSAVRVVTMLTIASLVIGLFVTFFIIRNLVSRMTKLIERISISTIEIQGVSGKLSGASQGLADGVTKVASSLEQTAATLEELSSGIQQNANNAKEANSASCESNGNAVQGEKETKALINVIDELATNSKRMSEIISVIDDIAFQTNLLALNAAVEAARAGDQGRGFAVVSEAVRNLAQRSSSSAKDISVIISDSVRRVQDAVKVVSRSEDALGRIVHSVHRTSDLTRAIEHSSQEQATGVSQISAAMNSLDGTTQQNAAASQEIANSAQILESQTAALQEIVAIVRNDFIGASKNANHSVSLAVTRPTARPRKGHSESVIPFADEQDDLKSAGGF